MIVKTVLDRRRVVHALIITAMIIARACIRLISVIMAFVAVIFMAMIFIVMIVTGEIIVAVIIVGEIIAAVIIVGQIIAAVIIAAVIIVAVIIVAIVILAIVIRLQRGGSGLSSLVALLRQVTLGRSQSEGLSASLAIAVASMVVQLRSSGRLALAPATIPETVALIQSILSGPILTTTASATPPAAPLTADLAIGIVGLIIPLGTCLPAPLPVGRVPD